MTYCSNAQNINFHFQKKYIKYNTIQIILLLITTPKIEQNNHNKFSYNDWNDLYE